MSTLHESINAKKAARLLAIGLGFNLLWIAAYVHFMRASAWPEGALVRLYTQEKYNQFFLLSYASDLVGLACIIASCTYFWILSTRFNHRLLKDATRAIIILLGVGLLLLQPLLILSYNFGPRSW